MTPVDRLRQPGIVLTTLLLVVMTLATPMPIALATSPAVMLKDIYVGPNGSSPSKLTLFGDAAFFSAKDGTNATASGSTLWKTDGTAAGTVKVKDIEPLDLTVFNGALYFLTEDTTNARELWKSDGTTAGTALLKRAVPANPDARSASPELTAAGNLLFFSVGTELWKSDGTAAGTALVKDIEPGASRGLDDLKALGARVLFPGPSGGLWASDGTATGTVLLKGPGSFEQNNEFFPFNEGGHNSAQIDRVLYFAAYTTAEQTELWRSDGTVAGTFLVKDINPGGGLEGGSWPRNLMAIGNTLFFTTFDINDMGGCSTTFNMEQSGLWASDGTAAGTVRLSSRPGECRSWDAYDMANIGGVLYYTTNGALMKSDGTPQGTVLVRERFQNNNQFAYGPIGNALGTPLFNVYDSATQATSLWRSDGTDVGTTLIQAISAGPAEGVPANFVILGNTLLFTADDGVSGNELWSAALPDLLRVSAPITPAGGGQMSSLDGRVQVSFPPGATVSDLTVSIAPLARPSQPLDGRQSLRSFMLEARDGGGSLVTQFSKPYTLTITYSDTEASGLFEPGINLTYWNGSAWINLLPCSGCSIDMMNDRIIVRVDHFTEFALLGATEHRVYLPFTTR